MNTRHVIVLTGGPGGGKTTLIQSLQNDLLWTGRLIALPEAIQSVGKMGVSLAEKRFQKLMVNAQIDLEERIKSDLPGDDRRILLCHRGSLDPLAYWLDRGWGEEEFFAFTSTKRQMHYDRYSAVIHLVTAACGAASHYRRWPQAHRPEQPEDAIRLDRLLEEVWAEHPGYVKIDNVDKDWPAKAALARDTLRPYLEI